MCHFMKTLLFLFSILFLTNSYAQITFDKNVERQYQEAYKKLPTWLKEKAKDAYDDTNFRGGIVVLTEYVIDTLNKDELTDKSTFKSDKVLDYDLLFCGGILKLDTLLIEIGAPFFSQSIKHEVFKNLVATNYNQYNDNDSLFRTQLTKDKTNNLTIPAETTNFILSDNKFTSGKTIFGYAEMVTNPYYEDAYLFKNGYIKKRLRYKYYFNFKPVQNGT
jgi:hypothetical protein